MTANDLSNLTKHDKLQKIVTLENAQQVGIDDHDPLVRCQEKIEDVIARSCSQVQNDKIRVKLFQMPDKLLLLKIRKIRIPQRTHSPAQDFHTRKRRVLQQDVVQPLILTP